MEKENNEAEGHAKGHTDSRISIQLFIPRHPSHLPVFLNNVMIYEERKGNAKAEGDAANSAWDE